MYVIMKQKVPVLFVELRTYVAYDANSTCKAMDDQMHNRVLNFTAGNVPIPKLYGLSTYISIHFQITCSPHHVLFLTLNLLQTLHPRRDGILIYWNHRVRPSYNCITHYGIALE